LAAKRISNPLYKSCSLLIATDDLFTEKSSENRNVDLVGA
jgi:tagatose-1,6-bisphosphate aldolase